MHYYITTFRNNENNVFSIIFITMHCPFIAFIAHCSCHLLCVTSPFLCVCVCGQACTCVTRRLRRARCLRSAYAAANAARPRLHQSAALAVRHAQGAGVTATGSDRDLPPAANANPFTYRNRLANERKRHHHSVSGADRYVGVDGVRSAVCLSEKPAGL